MSIHLSTNRQPAVVATDVCLALACGFPGAVQFFQTPPVEIRLATATYLELLSNCETEPERKRVKRFVQGYPVLSIGPMASAGAVEILLGQQLPPLEALAAATALAHEIPLVTGFPELFQGIDGLELIALEELC